MAFEVINTSEVDVGDPVTRSLLLKIKNSLDDLQSRTTAVEASGGRVDVFSDFVVYNSASFSSLNGLLLFRASADFTLTEARIAIFEAGTFSGFLEIDVKKSPDLDPSNFVTVFNTKPIIDYSTAVDWMESDPGDYDNAEKDIVAGEYLRLDITQVPTGNVLPMFMVIIYGEV